MKVDLEHFGLRDVPVDPDTVFTFAGGVAGFPACLRFKIFHQEGEKPAVFWLQSLDDGAVMFPIVAPETLDLEYEIELSDADCELLGLERAEDAAVVIIVYRNEAEGGEDRGQYPFTDHPQSGQSPRHAENPARSASNPALSGALIPAVGSDDRPSWMLQCKGSQGGLRSAGRARLVRQSVFRGADVFWLRRC